MLRMYVAQQCFGLSDEGIEDAIYDSQVIRALSVSNSIIAVAGTVSGVTQTHALLHGDEVAAMVTPTTRASKNTK